MRALVSLVTVSTHMTFTVIKRKSELYFSRIIYIALNTHYFHYLSAM